MNSYKAIVAVLMILCAGCSHTSSSIDKNDPTYKAILGCTAGILTGYQADFEASLNKSSLNLKSEGDINSFVKGYIFENLPEADRLKAYEYYLKCYQEQTKSQSTMPINQTMINSPSSLQVGGDLIVNPDAPNNSYKPLRDPIRLSLVNQLKAINQKSSDNSIIFNVSVETGNSGRFRVARELVEILQSSGFQTTGPSSVMTFYAANSKDSPPSISVAINPENFNDFLSIFEQLQSFLKVTFSLKKDDRQDKNKMSVHIYGEPIFSEDGTVSFP